nr:hypothetical protein [Tanacetum cinerariifolium]
VMDSIQSSDQGCVSQNSVLCNVVDQSYVTSDRALIGKYTEEIVAYEQESDERQAVKRGKEKAIEKSLKNKNACSSCENFDHNKRKCHKRFEDQEKVVVQQESVVQAKEILVQE